MGPTKTIQMLKSKIKQKRFYNRGSFRSIRIPRLAKIGVFNNGVFLRWRFYRWSFLRWRFLRHTKISTLYCDWLRSLRKANSFSIFNLIISKDLKNKNQEYHIIKGMGD